MVIILIKFHIHIWDKMEKYETSEIRNQKQFVALGRLGAMF